MSGSAAGPSVFASLDALAAAVGRELGPGAWRRVDQDRVDAFAAATEDRQWIHTDPERAAAGPYGGTVAHGFLMLALLPSLVRELYRVDGLRMAVNYGLERVRFPAPLHTGRAVRAVIRFDAADRRGADALRLTSTVTVEAEHGDRPCCVAETVTLLYR